MMYHYWDIVETALRASVCYDAQVAFDVNLVSQGSKSLKEGQPISSSAATISITG